MAILQMSYPYTVCSLPQAGSSVTPGQWFDLSPPGDPLFIVTLGFSPAEVACCFIPRKSLPIPWTLLPQHVSGDHTHCTPSLCAKFHNGCWASNLITSAYYIRECGSVLSLGTAKEILDSPVLVCLHDWLQTMPACKWTFLSELCAISILGCVAVVWYWGENNCWIIFRSSFLDMTYFILSPQASILWYTVHWPLHCLAAHRGAKE